MLPRFRHAHVPVLTTTPSAPIPSPDAALVRALGVRQLTAAVVNATVGAGIFVIPALVARDVGAAAPLAFLICGGVMALIVVTIAMAGSRVEVTGGIYAYAEAAFGPYVALLAGVLQWLSGLLAVSGVSTALLDQFGVLAPALGSRPARVLVLGAIVATLASVNARGVRSGSRLIEGVTAVKLVPLAAFVALGAFAVDGSALHWPGLPAAGPLGRTVLLLIFAYSGVEVAIAPSGEIRDPARTVPRAVFLALGATTLLYVAIQLVAQGVLGSQLAGETAAPLAAAAGRFLGRAGIMLMLAGAVCSMFGYQCGDMLSTPRSLYALARDGFMPSVFARINPVHHTPSVAIWTHAALVLLLAATNTFQALAIISNVGLLLLYLLACGAAIELQRRGVHAGGAPFAPRGAWLGPVLGTALILWILSTATLVEASVTAGVLAVATLAYLVRRNPSSSQSSTGLF